MVNQQDLSTVLGLVAAAVEAAPYHLPSTDECEDCDPTADPKYPCQSCHRCCPCAACDKTKRHFHLFVCSECGCRVWYTRCAPTVCLCPPTCDCTRCCTELWGKDEFYPSIPTEVETLLRLHGRLDSDGREILGTTPSPIKS